MHNQAAQAYQKTSQATVGPRELEASLLMKAATRLQVVIDDWENHGRTLDDAVTYNRKLWTILVTSATQAENPLPTDIKQNLANLGLFVFRQSIGVLANPQPQKLASIVNINRALAEGLRNAA